jgi:hypothetical protein
LILSLARDSSVAGSANGHTAIACMLEYGMFAQFRTNKKKALQHYMVAYKMRFAALSLVLYILLYFCLLGSTVYDAVGQ